MTLFDPNIRSGLYGVEVDPMTSLDDIDTFHAQFIPADMLKPRDLNNVGKQSAKMYPDKTRMSARKFEEGIIRCPPETSQKGFQ